MHILSLADPPGSTPTEGGKERREGGGIPYPVCQRREGGRKGEREGGRGVPYPVCQGREGKEKENHIPTPHNTQPADLTETLSPLRPGAPSLKEPDSVPWTSNAPFWSNTVRFLLPLLTHKLLTPYSSPRTTRDMNVLPIQTEEDSETEGTVGS